MTRTAPGRAVRHAALAAWLVALAAGPFSPAWAGPPPAQEYDTPALSFSVSPHLLGNPVAARVPACPLDDPGAVPDGVAPEHAAVAFAGSRPLPPDARLSCNLPDFRFAQLRVFPAAAYERLYPEVAQALAELRRVLDAGAPGAGATVPFVPYLDAFPAFSEHAAIVAFQNGRGVAFLTQWMFEPDTIGTRLVYVFQGLSADGTRYVLGLFPVRMRADPAPFAWPAGEPIERTYARFRSYAAEAARTVGAARPADFTPDLEALLALLRSLRVK